jgi:nitrate reductase gamma subunit
MIDFIRGPLVWIAFVVFFGGLAYQFVQFFNFTRRKEKVFAPSSGEKEKQNWTRSFADSLKTLPTTILGTHPVMAVVTSVFHVCLFLAPIFLLAHGILLYDSQGIGFWSFRETTSDVLTVVLIGCVVFFLLRRIFVSRVRVITTGYDYLVLAITVAPFVSGFLAYHQWFDYKTILVAHILAGEVMLIVAPFTKLGHLIFFFLYRFFIGSEYSFGQGTRTW